MASLSILLLALLALDTPAGAETPAHGLSWNRSGLPAVFPLQVKTDPGRNYRLTLLDTGTGAAVLAADIEGGRFFRVLVPPGTFRLQFDHGQYWQDEEHRFGPGKETGHFTLSDPLRFEILDGSTRQGHVVDLTGFRPGQSPTPEVRPQRICQGLRYEPRDPRDPEDLLTRDRFVEDDRLPDMSRSVFDPDRAARLDGLRTMDFDLEIRSHYCD